MRVLQTPQWCHGQTLPSVARRFCSVQCHLLVKTRWVEFFAMFSFLLFINFFINLYDANSLVFALNFRTYPPSIIPKVNTPPEAWEHVKVACYVQPLPPDPPVQRLIPKECEAAMGLIVIGDKASAPMDFSDDKTKGYPVPVVWGCGRCQIILHASNVGPNEVQDTFSLALVAYVASRIITKCLLELPFQVGGEALLGPKKVFEVIVGGLVGRSNGTSGVPYSKNISSIHSICPGVGSSWAAEKKLCQGATKSTFCYECSETSK